MKFVLLFCAFTVAFCNGGGGFPGFGGPFGGGHGGPGGGFGHGGPIGHGGPGGFGGHGGPGFPFPFPPFGGPGGLGGFPFPPPPPPPPYLRLVNATARREYVEIFRNRNQTIAQQEDAVLDWAENWGISDEVNAFNANKTAKQNEINDKVTALISELPAAWDEFQQIMNNKDQTPAEQREALKAFRNETGKAANVVLFLPMVVAPPPRGGPGGGKGGHGGFPGFPFPFPGGHGGPGGFPGGFPGGPGGFPGGPRFPGGPGGHH